MNNKHATGTNQAGGVPGETSDKNDNLLLLIEIHRAEVQHHENYLGSEYNWALTIILALTGSYLALATTEAWKSNPAWHVPIQGGWSVLLCVVAAISAYGLKQRLRAINENAIVVAKASRALGLFDAGSYVVTGFPYPPRWERWGDPEYRTTKLVPVYNYSMLFVLSGSGILAIWVLN